MDKPSLYTHRIKYYHASKGNEAMNLEGSRLEQVGGVCVWGGIPGAEGNPEWKVTVW